MNHHHIATAPTDSDSNCSCSHCPSPHSSHSQENEGGSCFVILGKGKNTNEISRTSIFTMISSILIYVLLLGTPLISPIFALYCFPLCVCTVAFVLLNPSIVKIFVKFVNGLQRLNEIIAQCMSGRVDSTKVDHCKVSFKNGAQGDSMIVEGRTRQLVIADGDVANLAHEAASIIAGDGESLLFWLLPALGGWTHRIDHAAHALASHFELQNHQRSVVKVALIVAGYLCFSFFVFCATVIRSFKGQFILM